MFGTPVTTIAPPAPSTFRVIATKPKAKKTPDVVALPSKYAGPAQKGDRYDIQFVTEGVVGPRVTQARRENNAGDCAHQPGNHEQPEAYTVDVDAGV
jgi:hypothetical protein